MNKKILFFTLSIVMYSFLANAQVDKIAKMMEGLDMPDNYKGFIDERYLISKKSNLTFKLDIYLPISCVPFGK